MSLQFSTPTLASLYQQATAHAAAGQYDQAALLYEQILEADPDFRPGYWQLGLMRLLQGHESEAQLTWMMALADAEPGCADSWTLELLAVLEQAALEQESAEQLELAWTIRQHLREIDPAEVHNLLHLVRLSLALKRFEPEELRELGLIDRLRRSSGDDTEAAIDPTRLLNVLEQGLEEFSGHPAVLDWAEACLAYVQEPESWIKVLLRAAARLSVLFRNDRLASRYAELCLRLDPDHLDALLKLAGYYQDMHRYQEGIEFAERFYAKCQTALQKVFGNAMVLRGYMSAGADWAKAEALLHQQTTLLDALVDEPVDSDRFIDCSLMTSPIYFYPYFGDRPTETRRIQNRVAQFFQERLQAFVDKHIDDYQPYPKAGFVQRDRRKLRIGYLSRSLWRHSVGWLSRWIFQHYDRDRFEVYVYFGQLLHVDSFTRQWFADPATQACLVHGDILGIAKEIRADEIDILVDLDSLTTDLNCGVTALKPAPVQVSWLGFDASGLPAVDYFIADPYVLPEEAQASYRERIWRLPQTYIAVDGFEVGVPSLRRDQLGIPADAVVYLSSQVGYKRYPDMIRLQMQILKQVPNSYFLIKGMGDERGIQARFEQMAEAVGVDRDRLRFLPRDRSEEVHRANLAIADIVLDTFPYNGATTTLETLWMGIPIVTRVGQQFAARNSYTMLRNAGISEGIAWTDAEYVTWGVRLGCDSALRQQVGWKLLRARQTAPLWNAKQFTQDLEHAYEQMWALYCQQEQAIAP